MRKFSQAETACLLAILIILGIGCEKSKRQASDVDTTTFIIEHSRIPDVDTLKLWTDLSIRRISIGMKADSVDKQYYIYAAMYYKTDDEKYRRMANECYRLYQKLWKLYAARQDSIDKKIYW